MQRLFEIVTLIICATLFIDVHAQGVHTDKGDVTVMMPPSRIYVIGDSLANPVNYLQTYPDTASMGFASDFFKWQWGKRIRTNPATGGRTTRGTQAYNDAQYGLNRWCNILTTIFRYSVTSSSSPKMIPFIYNVGESGAGANVFAKPYFMRRRPLDQMYDDAWGRGEVRENLIQSWSYPSSHSSFGWAVALAVSEMIPELQDTLMARAYSYGENRAIVGAHWMSDVEAGFLTASTAVAHMHTLSVFTTAMAEAREEYYTKRGTQPATNVGLPNGRRIQAYSAIDTASVYYYSDLQGYWLAKSLRNTARGDSAVMDANDSESAILKMYGDILGTGLTSTVNPYTTQLILLARKTLMESARQMSASGPFRKRPFVQLGEPTLIPGQEEYYSSRSSYPSTKAMLGWGLSLVLAEVAPEHAEKLYKRGFDYGHSRVIAGFNYPSDVTAGRLQATAVVARLHADETFQQLMQLATYAHQDSYYYIVTPVDDITVDDVARNGDVWYTTTGIRLRSKPSLPGIYIHNGCKVVVRTE